MAHLRKVDIEIECLWHVARFCVTCERELSSGEILAAGCCPYCGHLPVRNKTNLDSNIRARRWVYDVEKPTLRAGHEEEGHWECKDEQKEAEG